MSWIKSLGNSLDTLLGAGVSLVFFGSLVFAPFYVLNDLQRPKQTDEERAQTYVEKAKGLRAEHKHQKAIEACSKAIKLNPNYGFAYAERAFNHQLLGYEKSECDYEKAIKKDPKNARDVDHLRRLQSPCEECIQAQTTAKYHLR